MTCPQKKKMTIFHMAGPFFPRRGETCCVGCEDGRSLRFSCRHPRHCHARRKGCQSHPAHRWPAHLPSSAIEVSADVQVLCCHLGVLITAGLRSVDVDRPHPSDVDTRIRVGSAGLSHRGSCVSRRATSRDVSIVPPVRVHLA